MLGGSRHSWYLINTFFFRAKAKQNKTPCELKGDKKKEKLKVQNAIETTDGRRHWARKELKINVKVFSIVEHTLGWLH